MNAQELFLGKIQEDEVFAGKVFKVDNSKEDVQNISKEAGIEISLEELEELSEQFMKASVQQEGELSDDDLEAVAGGATPAFAATIGIAHTTVQLYKERDTIVDVGKKIFSGW